MSPTRLTRVWSKKTAEATGMGAAILALLVVALLAASLFFAAGCGYGEEVGDGGAVDSSSTTDTVNAGEEDEGSETDATDETDQTDQTDGGDKQISGDTRTVTLYFSKNPEMTAVGREIPATKGIGAAAVKALLEGPTEAEEEYGLYTDIPDDTSFLGLDIVDGIATVDLSQEYASGGGSLSMTSRLAQVVFTLTQFDTVDGVNFMLDGEPVTVFGGEGVLLEEPVDRSRFEGLSPAILVESPTIGDTVHSPLRIYGTANTFEAVFQVNIVNWDGLIIAEEMVQATSGSGTRGTFDVTVPYEVKQPGRGTLIVFEESARDGSPTNVVEIPLDLQK